VVFENGDHRREIGAVHWAGVKPGRATEHLEAAMPTIIDVNAEAAKLTMLRGRTPRTTREERKGSGAYLGPYRDGMLLVGKSAGMGHWETHPEDELVWVLDGAARLDVVQDDGPHSYTVGAGMVALVPPGVWHRFYSAEGRTSFSAVVPGDNIEVDDDDPRASVPYLDLDRAKQPPIIVDLNAELPKLTMFRGRTPRSTMADRKGSAARLAPYRDGALTVTKFAGKGHWEAHLAGDELIYVLDGMATLHMMGEDGPHAFALSAGMLAINPQGTWHRFSSADGVTLLTLTPSPSEVIDLDVDDPRQAGREPA
jgi:mannose-6-phosphate isomerase-like protein (cupin superfamily)